MKYIVQDSDSHRTFCLSFEPIKFPLNFEFRLQYFCRSQSRSISGQSYYIKPSVSVRHKRTSAFFAFARQEMAQELISVAAVEAIMGYHFNHPTKLWLALQAAGSGIGGPDGNKPGAMIGDAVMRLIIVDDLAATGRTRGM
jgi:hypothetical protein